MFKFYKPFSFVFNFHFNFEPRLIWRSIKFFWQRITRGFDDSDTWALNTTIARFALPRLKRFRELTIGYPMELTPEEWDFILKELEWLLGYYAKDCPVDYIKENEDERFQNASELLGKYFGNLWW